MTRAEFDKAIASKSRTLAFQGTSMRRHVSQRTRRMPQWLDAAGDDYWKDK